MIFDYLPLRGSGATVRRPVVNVFLEGLSETGISCLVDSGALHNRFDETLADLADIDLTHAEETAFIIAGKKYGGRSVDVQLRLGDYYWNSSVCFVRGWDRDFQILGQEGFFRHFDICFNAADYQLSVEPASH
jgi:hypothetical protein